MHLSWAWSAAQLDILISSTLCMGVHVSIKASLVETIQLARKSTNRKSDNFTAVLCHTNHVLVLMIELAGARYQAKPLRLVELEYYFKLLQFLFVTSLHEE